MNRVSWRERVRAGREDWRALAVIALFFVLFFIYLPLSRKHFVAADALEYTYPLRMVAWDAIRAGQMPLWTPLLLAGYPLLSMAQLGLGYPLTWGYLFLPGHIAEQIYILAPYLLCPAFTFLYARELGRTRLAAILAGLTFGYGGLFLSPLGSNGMMNNATMWLPLLLIAAERVRTRPFIRCLLGATGAYAMSVLTGIGQGFLFAGGLAMAYALFLALLPAADGATDENRWRGLVRRLRPALMMGTALLLSAGVACFQILETMRAQRRSIRSTLTYDMFGEGSLTTDLAWKSFIRPLFCEYDTNVFVFPLAVVLAAVAVVYGLQAAARGRAWDPRILFWLVVAVLGCVLILGVNTSLYKLAYKIPVLNRFRVPARHTFEWTFGVAVLAAYGWDALSRALAARAGGMARGEMARRAIVALLLLASGACAVLWFRGAMPPTREVVTGLTEAQYLWYKAAFFILTALAIWQGWRLADTRWRHATLTAAVMLVCLPEPLILAYCWWNPYVVPVERFTYSSPVSRFLKQSAPEQNRVYTRVSPFYQFKQFPPADLQNMSMLQGLHNVAGYEPLILERFSNALGNVGLDTVGPRPGSGYDRSLLSPGSHVLDLLNTTYLVESFEPEKVAPTMFREGIGFAASETGAFEISPATPVSLSSGDMEGDMLALVTNMAESGHVAQGEVVAELRITTEEGERIDRVLRAGTDTAEWAHDRADVLPSIKHGRAEIFDSYPGDNQNSYQAHRYWTRIGLGKRVRLRQVEFIRTTDKGRVLVWSVSLHDTATARSIPLTTQIPSHWEKVFSHDVMTVFRNKRVLPRAWLVAEAESAGPEGSLFRIQGKSLKPFDPRRTVLLEKPAHELPALPGGPIAPDARADIRTYEPGNIVIETKAGTAAVLVVSEVEYRGWEAWVDGAKAPILTANYFLRGVALPAGAHRVEMRYSDSTLPTGATVSMLTLALIGALGIHARRLTRRAVAMRTATTEREMAPASPA
ncbi:MAG: hypothetical protein ACKV2V_10740 [Blastocatellia bacterium]